MLFLLRPVASLLVSIILQLKRGALVFCAVVGQVSLRLYQKRIGQVERNQVKA